MLVGLAQGLLTSNEKSKLLGQHETDVPGCSIAIGLMGSKSDCAISIPEDNSMLSQAGIRHWSNPYLPRYYYMRGQVSWYRQVVVQESRGYIGTQE